jgi:agmatinase
LNSDKLAALRTKYADAKGGDIFDPEFAAVATQVFSSPDRRKWPFADPATLLGAPFRGDAPSLPDFGGLDVALVGVPMDLGVTNRAGARLGPRAVRAVERIGPYDHVLRIAPSVHLAVADIGDVPMRSRFSLDECHADNEAIVTQVCEANV